MPIENDPNTRAPSGPLAGLLRGTVVTAIAVKIAAFTAPYGFDEAVVTGVLVGLVTALGKVPRDKGFAWAQF